MRVNVWIVLWRTKCDHCRGGKGAGRCGGALASRPTWRITFLGSQLFKFWKENYNIYITSNACVWLILWVIPLGFGYVSYFFVIYFTPPFLSGCQIYISTERLKLEYSINRSRDRFTCLQRVVLWRKQSRVRRDWAEERKNRGAIWEQRSWIAVWIVVVVQQSEDKFSLSFYWVREGRLVHKSSCESRTGSYWEKCPRLSKQERE